jgi:hypothetical protein
MALYIGKLTEGHKRIQVHDGGISSIGGALPAFGSSVSAGGAGAEKRQKAHPPGVKIWRNSSSAIKQLRRGVFEF